MTVYVLQEEVDIIAVFKTKELAYKLAAELGLRNFHVYTFQIRGD